jgi:hypothetical protein
MSEKEIKDTLADIKEMILADKNYFDKVKTDPMYDNIRSQVNRLLEDIFREKKEKVEKDMSSVKFAVKKMEKWSDSKYAQRDDVQKYNNICRDISNIGNKLRRSYGDYVETCNILSSSIQIINEIQTSIKNNLRETNSYLYNANKSLDKKNDDIADLNRKKSLNIRNNIILTLLPIIVLAIYAINGYSDKLNAKDTVLLLGFVIVGGNIFTMVLKNKEGYISAAIMGFPGFIVFCVIMAIIDLILGIFGHRGAIYQFFYITIVIMIIYAIVKKDNDIESKLENLMRETAVLKEQIGGVDQKIKVLKDSTI